MVYAECNLSFVLFFLRKGGNIYRHCYNSNRQQSPPKRQNIFFPILIYKIDLFPICNWIPIMKQLLYSYYETNTVFVKDLLCQQLLLFFAQFMVFYLRI